MVRRISISFLRHFSRLRLSTTAGISSSRLPASFSPNPLTRLKFALRAKSDPEKLLALFQSSTDLPPTSQKSDPSAPKSEGFFIRIMMLYSAASMPDHASRTFEQIPVRTEQSLCALLTAYLKQGQHDRVQELFDRVPGESGVVAGVATHNILLATLCDRGKVHAARQLLDEMPEKKGLEPNIISYNTVTAAYLKREDDVGFHDILQQIDRKVIDHNVVTYNLRIADFCKRKESFNAEELLHLMVSKGIEPNLSTFNTLINGFCTEGNSESALRLFEGMKKMKREKGKKGVTPSPDTYIILICSLVENKELALAEQICRECFIKGFAPPFEAMKALINGLAKDAKVQEAKDLVDKMRTVVKGSAAGSWRKLEGELLL
ncbi:Pentatricopeptide repeat-containing protein [Apostasia shenzhenica]|uniref:Pentatricopeptide repeat-containing protein n=1 Tax=Apostasia shenzhenica TaxID=1088818 RepID=A0A2I0AHJ9_9ASPA|nr:Pentatricopeptide repeat-containing protein [Apostasia shenzhenica]